MKCFVTASLVAFVGVAGASDLKEALPLTSQVVMLHFDDGEVRHHKIGQKRSEEFAIVKPLSVGLAQRPASYRIVSAADPAYKKGVSPVRVSRKSKGTDFAWMVQNWVNGRAQNTDPDHAKEHWIYLHLPRPMQAGKTYTIQLGGLASNGSVFRVTYDPKRVRSEAVHVNALGYAPVSPAKFAYVYHWMGDGRGLDLKAVSGKKFWLIDQATKQPAFEGRVAFRRPANAGETGQGADTPNANFQNADVYECDFSDFTTPGTYVVAVDGVGTSFPFKLDHDAYRPAFYTVARGLYHNRSGIELKRPYTEFVRPAPHRPGVTPGFKLYYTTSRSIDWRNEDHDPLDKAAIEKGLKGELTSWGWYQDAGDWDSYVTHLRVAQELLLAFELAPQNFSDGELNIPESKNGVPDILDEAAWLPRFCHRLRQELIEKKFGTGGIGLRVCGDHFGGDTGPKDVGTGSWQDVNRRWIVSGEDPISTFRYAGVAAHLAIALKRAGVADPEKVDWAKEARESYEWAQRNLRTGDEVRVRDQRRYAAATLFRLTGDKAYEAQFGRDSDTFTSGTNLYQDIMFGSLAYVLGPADRDATILARNRAAVLYTADMMCDSADKRAMRWGGDFFFPMLVGQQSTPMVMPVAVARELVRTSDPAKARRYLGVLYTTADYFLGTNALNMAWSTGLGPRHPNRVFSMDSWYNTQGGLPSPGIVPYGPWRKEKDFGDGPWDVAWANQTVYPNINEWPGAERWFDNQCSPMSTEFTIHQNTAPAAAIYAILCGVRR